MECAQQNVARLSNENVPGVLAEEWIELTQMLVNQTRDRASSILQWGDHKID